MPGAAVVLLAVPAPLLHLDRQRPIEKVSRLGPRLAGRALVVHRRGIVVIESVAGALVDMELRPWVMRKSLPDRLLLLSGNIVVGAAEVEEDRAPDLSGQAQSIGNG
jgi:hypothetical protein